jgi:hypothetical protein
MSSFLTKLYPPGNKTFYFEQERDIIQLLVNICFDLEDTNYSYNQILKIIVNYHKCKLRQIQNIAKILDAQHELVTKCS